MVSFFSLFSSKKQVSSAHTSASSQRSSTSHQEANALASSSDGQSSKPAATNATKSRPRPPSRFLSLRRKSTLKPYDSREQRTSLDLSPSLHGPGPASGNGKTQQTPQVSRSSSGKNLGGTLYTPLQLDLPLDFGGTAHCGDGQVDTLGLESVGGRVTLGVDEKKALDGVRLGVEDVQKSWQWFGSALKEIGMDTSGIMLPRRVGSDARTQFYLLALYILTIRPHLRSSFPSITSVHPQTPSSSPYSTDQEIWQERLVAAVHVTHNAIDVAEVLKWTLRRLAPSHTSSSSAHVLSSAQYVRFVQAEHMSSYPLDAYHRFVLQDLDAGAKSYLNEIFEVLSTIATHAEENTMSAGRLAYLLGFWMFGANVKGRDIKDWNGLYEAWKDSGEKTEHLLYAWIRYQSTIQQLPTRLLELVEEYPFGDSSASSEHLPHPPPSSFSRQTLHIVLQSNKPIEGILSTAQEIVETALRSNFDSQDSVPIWATLVRQDASVGITDILAEESLDFLRDAAAASSHTPPTSPAPFDFSTPIDNLSGPMYRPFSTISASRTTSEGYVRQRSQFHTTPTPAENIQSPLRNREQTNGDSPKSIRHRTSNSVLTRTPSPAPPPVPDGDDRIWDSFQQSGFVDTPGTIDNLSLAVAFPPQSDLAAPLSPKSPADRTGPSGGGTRRVVRKESTSRDELDSERNDSAVTPSFRISSEKVIEVDDVFLAFVEDGQLDPAITHKWPPFALVRLSKPLASPALPAPGGKSIDWLLITVEDLPSTPSYVNATELTRSLSPGAVSATSRLSTTQGLRDFARSFKRSASSSFVNRPSSSSNAGTRRTFFGTSGRSSAKQGGWARESLGPLSERGSSSQTDRKVPESAQSLTPTEYTVGEMGEMVKIAPAIQEKEQEKVLIANTNDNANEFPTSSSNGPSSDSSSSDWVYVAEGGAHVVFAYRGTNATYLGRVLRIRKANSHTSGNDDANTDVQQAWRFDLLPRLLPTKLLVRAEEINLEEWWLRDLFAHADESRPDARKGEETLAELVVGNGRGLLMDDTTAVPTKGGSGRETDALSFAIEIKPKWGFLPDSRWLQPPESVSVKSQNCRFCMHQHLRGKGDATIDKDMVSYCPLDLYSGEKERMSCAIEGLWGMWRDTNGKGNNWRVFVNGVATTPEQADNIPSLSPNTALQGTSDFVLPVLRYSNVLRQLATLQSTLDATDITDLAARFRAFHSNVELFDPSLIPSPSLHELKEFIDVYHAQKDAGTLGDEEGGWTLRQRMIAYALSAIFKDCSIFVNCALVRASSSASSPPSDEQTEANRWELDLEQSSVKVIDLDLKPIKNLRQWYDTDEKIWRYWLDTHHPQPQDRTQPRARAISNSCKPDTPKKRKAVPPLLNMDVGLAANDGLSTTALSEPTLGGEQGDQPTHSTLVPKPWTAVDDMDGVSMADSSSLLPTKPAGEQRLDEIEEILEENGECRGVNPDQQVNDESVIPGKSIDLNGITNAHSQFTTSEGSPLTDNFSYNPVSVRRERSMAPSPSPRLERLIVDDKQAQAAEEAGSVVEAGISTPTPDGSAHRTSSLLAQGENQVILITASASAVDIVRNTELDASETATSRPNEGSHDMVATTDGRGGAGTPQKSGSDLGADSASSAVVRKDKPGDTADDSAQQTGYTLSVDHPAVEPSHHAKETAAQTLAGRAQLPFELGAPITIHPDRTVAGDDIVSAAFDHDVHSSPNPRGGYAIPEDAPNDGVTQSGSEPASVSSPSSDLPVDQIHRTQQTQ